MNLLCILGRHRWETVTHPGEQPYRWCERCARYGTMGGAMNARLANGGGRPWEGGATHGDGGGFGGDGSDGGGGSD